MAHCLLKQLVELGILAAIDEKYLTPQEKYPVMLSKFSMEATDLPVTHASLRILIPQCPPVKRRNKQEVRKAHAEVAQYMHSGDKVGYLKYLGTIFRIILHFCTEMGLIQVKHSCYSKLLKLQTRLLASARPHPRKSSNQSIDLGPGTLCMEDLAYLWSLIFQERLREATTRKASFWDHGRPAHLAKLVQFHLNADKEPLKPPHNLKHITQL